MTVQMTPRTMLARRLPQIRQNRALLDWVGARNRAIQEMLAS
jgi:hypothetical protein